jgi:hypothetical protein
MSEAFVTAYDGWLRGQTLSSLVPREAILALSAELEGDDAWWDLQRVRFDKAWARSEARLRGEERSLGEVIGKAGSERVVSLAESLDPDPEAVRTFLRSPAIESMLGEVLYQGIFEFIKKVDLVGRVVNKLPVLGGIRRKILAAFREEIENRLESQIKGFLGGFSGLAVERMIQFVLSDENRQGMGKARRRLAEHMLERPVKTLVPDAEAVARSRENTWKAIRESKLSDREGGLLDLLYRDYGDESFAEWALDLTPKGKALLAIPLGGFLASDAGRSWRPS